MVLLDTIVPRKWWNQLVSYLNNFVIKRKPVPNEWFRQDEFFVTKRLWTWTSDERVTDSDIVWHIVSWSNIYIWDEDCKVYRFNYTGGVYSFDKIYNNPDGFILDVTVKSKALELWYVSDLEATWVVNTYTTTSPYTLVTAAATFTSDDINKYVYISHLNNSWNFSVWGWQFKRITKVNSTTSVDLDSAFVIEPVAGDGIELYADINSVIVFNDIRKTVTDAGSIEQDFWLTLYDNGTSVADWYERNMIWDDILLYDSKLWTVEWGRTIWASYILNYEIIDSTSVIWNNSSGGRLQTFEDIIAIDEYQKFMMIYSTNSISLIRPIANTEGTTLYGYSKGLSGMTLYWPYSMTKKEGVPFIATNTKQIGIIEIKNNNEWVYDIYFNNQWYFIQDLLDSRIELDDTLRLFSDNETVNLMINKQWEDKTYLFRYYQHHQRWLPQEYNSSITSVFSKFLGDSYYTIWNKLCIAQGEDDLWDDIDQTFTIIWPQKEEATGRLCYLQQVVLMVGYYKNLLDFDVTIELWWDKFKLVVDKTTEGTLYTKRQNLASADWTLGTNILWYSILWGENVLDEWISKIAMLWIKVWKWFAWYYKVTLTNKDNSNINLGMIEPQYIAGNPYLVPIKNVF